MTPDTAPSTSPGINRSASSGPIPSFTPVPHPRRLGASLAGGLICVGTTLTLTTIPIPPHEIIAPSQNSTPADTTTTPHPAAEPHTGFGPLGATL
ncbi:hypothetical protein [Streptomyces sp. KLOTTS4A1]|uniref:hypothetical protein n=1 Tax=Streptomyces sp. KLOTTS4A1 TaxID=3390996 RepID=UPI0039F4BA88